MRNDCWALLCCAEMLLDKNVEREILNHRQLVHPNIIGFKEVYTTDTDLAIVVCTSLAISYSLRQKTYGTGNLQHTRGYLLRLRLHACA